jgi:hypothetical protein
VNNTDLPLNDPSRTSTIDVYVTVTAGPAIISFIPGSLSFTATAGSFMANESINVQLGNAGPAGSQLSYSLSDTSGGRLTVSGARHTIPAGFYDPLTFTFNTSGMAAGTYNYTLYVESSDPRVVDKTIPVRVTITGQTLPTWGAYESGENGRSSDQWYSISSSQMTIWFYAQPFGIPDRFVITDESGYVYINTGYISSVDNGFDVPIRSQSPKLYQFTKPAGVTRLRVQVIANTNTDTGWWYYGRTPGQLWY